MLCGIFGFFYFLVYLRWESRWILVLIDFIYFLGKFFINKFDYKIFLGCLLNTNIFRFFFWRFLFMGCGMGYCGLYIKKCFGLVLWVGKFRKFRIYEV